MAEELSEDTRAEADATPEKTRRRWLLEIRLAQKREKDWREKAKRTLDVYRGKSVKKNSFNILWANTEVLRPALYNSPPKPDVRRRFRQNDPLGKAVSEVMERGVSYCADAYDLDNCLQNDVLDSLLPGRGLSRVRYVPKFKTIPKAADANDTSADVPATVAQLAEGTEHEADREEVEYEQALCEHVQWDDFLHGAGKTWEEVQWNGFRHRLTRDDLIEKFGAEIGKEITLNDVSDDELHDAAVDEAQREVFKRAELWEIWDKEGGKVFFVSESYKKDVLYPKDAPKGEPPLRLKNFFPVPRPLQMFEDTATLVPTPLYELYRQQAEELDRISARINKIINACKVRFVHDSTLTELSKLMDAGDNEGIPAESARSWMTNGGIEKAIWWMPIDKIAAVLRELYVARDGCKQVIYEITGLSDILRGATDPNETLGAQKLKANSSSLRLQRMVAEVQRYTRDLIRLLAEVIGEHFDHQTLAQMTGLQFPTQQQKMQVQLQMQAAQPMIAQAQAAKQPIPPEVPQKLQQAQQLMSIPSWEDIMAVLRSDMQREYRVDVETDSTVAQSLQQDMEGLREVISGIVEFWQGVGPAVSAGAVSIEAVKAVTMSIVRRARMGLEVEDALEAGLKQPAPQDNGEAAKAQAEAAKEAEITKREQAAAQADLQREQLASQEKVKLDEQAKMAEDAKHARETAQKDSFERWKAELEADTKIIVAEIGASASVATSEIGAEAKAASAEGGEGAAPAGKPKRRNPLKEMRDAQGEHQGRMESLVQSIAEAHASFAALVGENMQRQQAESQSPAKVHRGADGRMAALEKGGRMIPIQRGPDGRVSGIGTLQ